MALNAAIQWEVRFGGSDTNGGGFKAGASGTDWSQQDSPQFSVTDAVTNGTTTITSASATFTSGVVGNVLYIQGGTGSITAGWYEVTTYLDPTSIVVDRSTGLTAGTGATLKLGGALATPARALTSGLAGVSGMKVWVKYNASPYLTTSYDGGVPGGNILFPTSIALMLIGYDVTRGDNTGNRPIFKAGIDPDTSGTLCTTAGSASQGVYNIRFDADSRSNLTGIALGSSGHIAGNCQVVEIDGSACTGITFVAGAGVDSCSVSAGNIGFSGSGGVLINCTAIGCVDGFTSSSNGILINCLAHGCSDDGFDFTNAGNIAINCTSDGNTGDGFQIGSNRCTLHNCLSTYNGGFAYRATSAVVMKLMKCADYNNTSGRVSSAALHDLFPITLSGDPYIDRASDDFRPDNTTNEGALLRDASIGVLGQADNADVGAVQHSDPTGVPAPIFGGLIAA